MCKKPHSRRIKNLNTAQGLPAKLPRTDNFDTRLTDLKFYVRLDTKTSHFRNTLLRQSLSIALKKLNLTQ